MNLCLYKGGRLDCTKKVRHVLIFADNTENSAFLSCVVRFGTFRPRERTSSLCAGRSLQLDTQKSRAKICCPLEVRKASESINDSRKPSNWEGTPPCRISVRPVLKTVLLDGAVGNFSPCFDAVDVRIAPVSSEHSYLIIPGLTD